MHSPSSSSRLFSAVRDSNAGLSAHKKGHCETPHYSLNTNLCCVRVALPPRKGSPCTSSLMELRCCSLGSGFGCTGEWLNICKFITQSSKALGLQGECYALGASPGEHLWTRAAPPKVALLGTQQTAESWIARMEDTISSTRHKTAFLSHINVSDLHHHCLTTQRRH